METKIESRVGTIASSSERIYTFISNFNNFKQFIPADKVKDFEATNDNCKFSVTGIGKVGLQIIEREPFKTIKVTGDGMANHKFVFWIQLMPKGDNDTHIKLTIKADINVMMKMMVEKPLQNFLDKLVDAMEKMQF